jgi:hypothetical protein
MVAAPALAEIDVLADDVAEVLLDLPSFGELVEIPTKEDGKVPFGWDRWHPEQRQFERERTGRDVVLKPRQIGFSTIELARDLQFARTREGVQVVVVVHTDAAKVELFSRVHLMVRCLYRWGLLPEPKEATKTGFRWDDVDSSIKIIEAGKDAKSAADKGRSGTIHRLHCTEVAFYSQPEETMVALLAAGERAEVVIESTANGTGTWFHDCVTQAQAGQFGDFAFHFFPWFAHPDYIEDPRAYSKPPDTKRARYWEEKLRALGCDDRRIAWWRKTVATKKLDKALREYPCTPEAAFTESASTWLEPEHIDRLRGEVRDPIEERRVHRSERPCGKLRVYELPEEGSQYILFADPSEGVGNNEAALVVIEHRTSAVVAAWHDNRTKPGELAGIVAAVGRLYNTALIAVERNTWRKEKGDASDGGRTTLAVLERDERYPSHRIYRDANGKIGWATTGESRPLIFGDLQKSIEDGVAVTPDRKTVEEAANLIIGNDGRPRARSKRGTRGDDGLFVAWGAARQVRERVPMPGPRKVTAQTVGPALGSSKFRT